MVYLIKYKGLDKFHCANDLENDIEKVDDEWYARNTGILLDKTMFEDENCKNDGVYEVESSLGYFEIGRAHV